LKSFTQFAKGSDLKNMAMVLVLLLSSLRPLISSARDFSPEECPVVGNTNSKIYHTQGGLNYRRMLQENKNGADNRECFQTEKAAQDAGYRKSKT
jgi:hypothetical protein